MRQADNVQWEWVHVDVIDNIELDSKFVLKHWIYIPGNYCHFIPFQTFFKLFSNLFKPFLGEYRELFQLFRKIEGTFPTFPKNRGYFLKTLKKHPIFFEKVEKVPYISNLFKPFQTFFKPFQTFFEKSTLYF